MRTKAQRNTTGKVKKNLFREEPSIRKARIARNKYQNNELGN